MYGVLPWMVRWPLHAGTRYFNSALAALVSPEQNVFFLSSYTISINVPIAQKPSAGSRAWPPVSKCVSPETATSLSPL
jgi:hypothetical protein